MIYRFEGYELNPGTFELLSDGEPVAIEPQTFSLLQYLVENRDRLVTRDDLLDAVWNGRTVSDWAISAGVKAARLALGDTETPRRFIRTIHARGFRFVAGVAASPEPDTTDSTGRDPADGLSIAVVPFDTLSAEDGRDYFADGLTEDLIGDLSHVPGLRAATRNASFSLKADRPSAGVVADRLGVTHVLEGSVRQHESQVRINAQLVECASGRPLWTDRFDAEHANIFSLQDQICARITGALKLQMSIRSNRRGTSDPDAYDACLQGRSEYYRYSPGHMAKAAKLFQAAIELDPDYAEAYAYQAYCRTATYVFAWPGCDETLEPAVRLAEKAIALNGRSAIAHARLGWVLGYLDQPDRTIACFKRATELDPASAEVFFSYGETMNRLARPERGLALLDKAFSIESFVPPSWNFGRGHAFALLRRHDKALDNMLPVLERVPGFVPARVQLARVYSEMGEIGRARSTVAALREIAPGYSLASARRMFPYPDGIERRRLEDALAGSGLST